MENLITRLDDVAAATGFSGVARLDRAGQVLVDAAYGLADRRHAIAMTTTTQLGMASGSKTFTAVVALSLVEQGLLSLETRARELLRDDLPLIADDVTVEHLLCHRSGIGDYLDEDELDSDDYPMPVSVHRLVTTEDFLPILDGYPTKFPAGERFSYCNGGYVVLALMAERASGRSYQALVGELVCGRAGMRHTGFLRSDDLPGSAAVGYVQVDGHWRTNVFHLPVVATGDGGVHTTTGDMVLFWDALMAGRLLTPGTLRTMLTPRSPLDEDGDGYALGCWITPATGRIAMSGGDAGVRFWSSHAPRDNSTTTVISNVGQSLRPVVEVLDSGR